MKIKYVKHDRLAQYFFSVSVKQFCPEPVIYIFTETSCLNKNITDNVLYYTCNSNIRK